MIKRDIRLSGEDRRVLFNVKNTIGIEHFYTTCRWAFCLSLDSDIDIKRLDGSSDGAVEISWDRFGGENANLYYLLLLDEAKRLNLKEDDKIINFQVLNEDKVLVVISNSSDTFAIVYDIKQEQIISIINK